VQVVIAAVLAGAALTSAGRAAGCATPSAPMQQVELYFGWSVKGEPFVTEATWSSFLANEVTPKFPDGLTVFDANGQWRSEEGRIYHEETRVVLILYKADDTTEAKIEAIRDACKTQFHQDNAPLRVDSTVCVAF
jgi:hypothetical protein